MIIKKNILIIILVLIFNQFLFSQFEDSKIRKSTSTLSAADEGVGLQTKGQLQNLIMNYGQLTDTRYEDRGNAPTDIFFNYRYPRQNFTGLCDDFSLFFAIPDNSKNGNSGNVIDGWTENDNEDWIAKDQSFGKTHYNPAGSQNPHPLFKYNNQTPLLAHSDLPETWPEDLNGKSFWPGWFRKNPQTGVVVQNEFASDRDIYFEFNDKNNQRGNPVGIEIHEVAYNYGRVYAEDFLLYEILLINKSGKQLNNCWLGYYQDPDCSDHGEEMLLIKDSTFANGTNVWAVAQRDFDGDIGGATKPNQLGVSEDYTFGTAFFETPKNLGVKSFHYFTDPGPSDDSQLWPIIISDPTNQNISATASQYFHGSNNFIDDANLISTKQDLAWIVATGPFTMNDGDTVRSVVAVIAGDDDADYYSNLWQAKQIYDAKFNGPSAPPSPNLKAVASDRKVSLYWDDTPENSVDPASGIADFEGYKIYRSEDNGTTWGKQITDALGRLFGYVPIAQFDLIDNIKGIDPKNSLVYLGDDTGLKHSFIDSNVVNGKKYSYTIISYDKGTPTLFSLEGSKGDGLQSKNFVSVTPLPVAQDIVGAKISYLNKISGNGTGNISIDILNSSLLKQNEYEITFHGTPATKFSLKRVDSIGTILYDQKNINTADLPYVDGFKIFISSDSKIGYIKSITDGFGKNVLGSTNLSSDSSWYVSYVLNLQADTLAKSSSYEIRFEEVGQVAFTWGLAGSIAQYNVPFKIWNTTTNLQVNCEIRDFNNNSKWDEGELIYIINKPYQNPTIGSVNPASTLNFFAYQIGINNSPNDTLLKPPTIGSVVKITSYNSLRADDIYRFKFLMDTKNSNLVDLNKIKFVPNPYIVTSQYENMQNVREARFMFLPSKCTIKIFTSAGEIIRTLKHESSAGSLSWNLLSEANQALAYGIYIYTIEDENGNRVFGKFALIK